MHDEQLVKLFKQVRHGEVQVTQVLLKLKDVAGQFTEQYPSPTKK
jgi:hypothetical protein